MFTLRHVATLTSNVALTYCILAMVAIELTLDLGFFPSYAWYTLAFSKLPFDLKVLEAMAIRFSKPKWRSLCPSCGGHPENGG